MTTTSTSIQALRDAAATAYAASRAATDALLDAQAALEEARLGLGHRGVTVAEAARACRAARAAARAASDEAVRAVRAARVAETVAERAVYASKSL